MCSVLPLFRPLAEAYSCSEDVERLFLASFRPDPPLTVSEWADRYRILSARLAAEPGPYRTARAPFLKDVMDALSPLHPARRVVFMKSAQVGATEVSNKELSRFEQHFHQAVRCVDHDV